MGLTRVLEPEVMDSPEEASDYDSMDHAEVNRIFVADLENAWEGMPRAAVDTAERSIDVLDLGTGTALIAIELCGQLADCRVMAVDAAVSMLDLARYNVEVAGLMSRIELAHMDAKALAFQSPMFDVVMSNSIVHHIPEPIQVLREGVRVARSGGLLFFRDLLRPESKAELEQLVDTYAEGANASQRKMFAESLQAALSLDEIRGLVASLGFSPAGVQQTSDRHWTWVAVK